MSDVIDANALKEELKQYGLEKISQRIAHLKKRHFVFFPILRARLLLRKLNKIASM